MIIYNTSLVKLPKKQCNLTEIALAVQLYIEQVVLCKYDNGDIIPLEDMQKIIYSMHDYLGNFIVQHTDKILLELFFHKKRSSIKLKTWRQIKELLDTRYLDIIKLFNVPSITSNINSTNGKYY